MFLTKPYCSCKNWLLSVLLFYYQWYPQHDFFFLQRPEQRLWCLATILLNCSYFWTLFNSKLAFLSLASIVTQHKSKSYNKPLPLPVTLPCLTTFVFLIDFDWRALVRENWYGCTSGSHCYILLHIKHPEKHFDLSEGRESIVLTLSAFPVSYD